MDNEVYINDICKSIHNSYEDKNGNVIFEVEASNENLDLQNQRTLQSALEGDTPESKIINNIYRFIGNLKKENNIENNFEGLVFINLEKKDNKTILYSFDKDGNATRYEDASYDYFKKIKGFVHESQVVENPRTEPSSSPTGNIIPLSNSVNKVKTDMSFSNDTIYGFVYNGKIYLNPDFMNSNAAGHEYTHL